MFTLGDTIAAIATPLGRGAIGIVRLSGPAAAQIAGELVGRTRAFEPRHATYSRLGVRPLACQPGPRAEPPASPPPPSRERDVRDQVVVIVYPAPHSSTGEEVAEISAHGSPVVLTGILGAAIARGARLAEPGEFTLRAFLNGRIDLVQAEAVADLIDAVTPRQARAAFDQLEGTVTGALAVVEGELFDLMVKLEASLDFPEEGYHFVAPGEVAAVVTRLRARIGELLGDAARGRLIREGAQVAIVGAPNVGKSSLFNALLNASRAIVTPTPGTTRDLVTERADLHGLSVALVDTAGIRDTPDEVEREGVLRARGALGVADLVIVVLDRSHALTFEDEALIAETAGHRRLIVVNKIDLPAAWQPGSALAADHVEISAQTGAHLDRLVEQIGAVLGAAPEVRDAPLVTNVRHIALLERAGGALDAALAAVHESGAGVAEEFLLADLQEAAAHLQEITGRRSTDELLRQIFSRFCIGK